MDMTKTIIKSALGLKTDAELARLLGVTRKAVHHWEDHLPIPQGRQWQLIAMRPDLFNAVALATEPATTEARAA